MYSLMSFITNPADKEITQQYCTDYAYYDFFDIYGNANPNLTGLSALLKDDSGDIIISYNYLCPFNIYATYKIDINSDSGNTNLINQEHYHNSLGSKPSQIFNGGELIVSGIDLKPNKNFEGNIEFVRDFSESPFNKIDNIEDYMFSGCKMLTTIRLPWVDELTIGNSSFSGCNNLNYFFCYNRVTSVGDNAFSDCVNLKGNEIACGNYIHRYHYTSNLPDCLKVCFDCGNYSFSNCTSLTGIAFHNSEYEDSANTTSDSGSPIIRIAKSNYDDRNRYKIGSYAFFNCTGLTSIFQYYIYMDDRRYNTSYNGGIYISLDDIDIENADYCFANCTGLSGDVMFYLGYGATYTKKIPEGMFSGCNSITSISVHRGSDSISNTVNGIGDDAFAGTGIPYNNGELMSFDDVATMLTNSRIVNQVGDGTTSSVKSEMNRIFGDLWPN